MSGYQGPEQNQIDALTDEINRLRELLSIVHYIASKASLTNEEKLIDIRNYTSVESTNDEYK